jgi:hypothetical protein
LGMKVSVACATYLAAEPARGALCTPTHHTIFRVNKTIRFEVCI